MSRIDRRPVRFWKMTGSGNDFVFIDETTQDAVGLDQPDAITRLCSRTDGVGADGVVFLRHGDTGGVRIRYYNRDGSRGELCGNASLCTTNLAVQLKLARSDDVAVVTDIGELSARVIDGLPEIDLGIPQRTRADAGIPLGENERRIGFTDTGVPHLVVLVDDVATVHLERRGRQLRHHPTLPAGANVNFVSPVGLEWRMRTYERGVEGETMACGTGAVACAVLLSDWGLTQSRTVGIRTTSGRPLIVSLGHEASRERPSLRGEGRVVFTGEYYLGDA